MKTAFSGSWHVFKKRKKHRIRREFLDLKKSSTKKKPKQAENGQVSTAQMAQNTHKTRVFDVWKLLVHRKISLRKLLRKKCRPEGPIFLSKNNDLSYSKTLIGYLYESIMKVFGIGFREKKIEILSKTCYLPVRKFFKFRVLLFWKSLERSTNESMYCMILWVKICEVSKKSQVGKFSVYRVKSVILKKK